MTKLEKMAIKAWVTKIGMTEARMKLMAEGISYSTAVFLTTLKYRSNMKERVKNAVQKAMTNKEIKGA